MKVFENIDDFRLWRKDKCEVVFVPTMGNLHEGHLDLVRQGKRLGKCVVVSIFVNPLQFGAGEDFASYPRTLDEDKACLKALGVDALFVPNEAVLYPQAQTYFIELPHLQNDLCGMARPGHFRGVATVVMKLFNIVAPQWACFGKKDFQQLAIIRAMVAQFNLPVQIVAVDTVRAKDGLALSSRNRYLSAEERLRAPALYDVLQKMATCIHKGERDYIALAKDHRARLINDAWQVDYLEVRCAFDLSVPNASDTHLVILIAARLGKTRLIDNLEVFLAD